jgi:uncharacterized membrane protein
MSSGIGEIIVGAIGVIFAVIIGIILMQALYPINPFMAIVGVILLILVGVVVIFGAVRGKD